METIQGPSPMNTYQVFLDIFEHPKPIQTIYSPGLYLSVSMLFEKHRQFSHKLQSVVQIKSNQIHSGITAKINDMPYELASSMKEHNQHIIEFSRVSQVLRVF